MDNEKKDFESIIDSAIIATFNKFGKEQLIYAINRLINEGRYDGFTRYASDDTKLRVNFRDLLKNSVKPEDFKKYILDNSLNYNEEVYQDFKLCFVDNIIFRKEGAFLDEALKQTAIKYGDTHEILDKRLLEYVYTGNSGVITRTGVNSEFVNCREVVEKNVPRNRTLEVIQSILGVNGIDYSKMTDREVISAYSDLMSKQLELTDATRYS